MESTTQIEIINKNQTHYEFNIKLPHTFGSYIILVSNKYYCSSNSCSINYHSKICSIDTNTEIHGTETSICGRCELVYDSYKNELLLQLMDHDIFEETGEDSLKYIITIIY